MTSPREVSTDAGPQVTSDPVHYVDDQIVFRQRCCPGCWTAITSSIVPVDHIDPTGDLARLSVGTDLVARQ